jgi:hypothetical protein
MFVKPYSPELVQRMLFTCCEGYWYCHTSVVLAELRRVGLVRRGCSLAIRLGRAARGPSARRGGGEKRTAILRGALSTPLFGHRVVKAAFRPRRRALDLKRVPFHVKRVMFRERRASFLRRRESARGAGA